MIDVSHLSQVELRAVCRDCLGACAFIRLLIGTKRIRCDTCQLCAWKRCAKRAKEALGSMLSIDTYATQSSPILTVVPITQLYHPSVERSTG